MLLCKAGGGAIWPPTERPVPSPQIWGWALAIVTPAAISGLPNAPATRCAPFQWYRNAFMTKMEVMDRRRCHLADIATSHNKAKVSHSSSRWHFAGLRKSKARPKRLL
ncbi:Uncharacterized protein HZ326_18684 [Fusarium oxysporum f. sp. albedinis]|nr:Uncharacterized protein HZ326_18684 [Fusarium oxysporum f. sp. albedinis]